MATEWVEQRPQACPNGHQWNTPGSFLAGWSADSGMGHRIWTCQTCFHTTHAHDPLQLIPRPTS